MIHSQARHRSKPLKNRALRVATRGLAIILALIIPSPGQSQSLDGEAEGYLSFLWMYRGPSEDPALYAALEALGVRGTNVFGPGDSRPAATAGRPFYVDHAAGKGILQLRDKDFLAQREAFLAGRERSQLVRKPCVSDPATHAEVLRRIDAVIEALGPRRPFALALDDEISLTLRNSAFDFCRGEHCEAAFRSWLKTRYGSPKKIASAWGRRRSAAFEEIILPSLDEIRRREFIRDPLLWNFADWNDHRAFMDQRFREVVHEWVAEVRKRRPGVRVGFTGGEAPSPFSGVDWATILPGLDFIEPYDVGGSRELVRSFADDDCAIFRTLFKDERGLRYNQHELYDYRLRGDRGVIIWSAEDYFDERKVESPSAWAQGMSETLRTLDGPALRAWQQADTTPAPVALVESAASNRMHWMLDSLYDGRGWVHRSSSFEQRKGSQNRCREAWQKLLEDLHVDYVHIAAESLQKRDLSEFKAIILPRTIALSGRDATALRRYAESGLLIADAQCALFDEKLRARAEGGALDEAFGLQRRNRRVYWRNGKYSGPRDKKAKGLQVAEPGIIAGEDAVVRQRVARHPCVLMRGATGGGRLVYLNLIVADYLGQRLGGDRHPLRRAVAELLRGAGVRSPLRLKVESDAGTLPLRVFVRRDGDAHLVALISNWRTSTIDLDVGALADAGPQRGTLELPRSVRVRQLLGPSRDVLKGERKTSIRFEVPLFAPVLFRFER